MMSIVPILDLLPFLEALFEAWLAQTWKFVIVDDERTCDVCRGHAGEIYSFTVRFRKDATEEEIEEVRRRLRAHFEDLLPGMFPNGEWADEDTFMAKLHPNCRCKVVFSSTERSPAEEAGTRTQ